MLDFYLFPPGCQTKGGERQFWIWGFCHLKFEFGGLEPFEIWIWIFDLIFFLNLDFGFGPVWKLDFGFQAVWNSDLGFPDPPLHTPRLCTYTLYTYSVCKCRWTYLILFVPLSTTVMLFRDAPSSLPWSYCLAYLSTTLRL